MDYIIALCIVEEITVNNLRATEKRDHVQVGLWSKHDFCETGGQRL